jgi:hypothetical protein
VVRAHQTDPPRKCGDQSCPECLRADAAISILFGSVLGE